jgi:hypothetical protein
MKILHFTAIATIASLSLAACGPMDQDSKILGGLSDTPEYSVKFVAADLTDEGFPKTEEINGVSRLVFRELSPDELLTYEPVVERISNSEVIQKALELRWEARSYKSILSGGKLSIEDSPSDPFYVVLKWSHNTLEASADHAVIYSRDGQTKFSSVSLIVTGLGPIAFADLMSIPFVSDAIMMHEIMHCTQIEATGPDQFQAGLMASSSMNVLPHKIHVLTDLPRAFAEGFAESFERIGGRLVNVDFQDIYDNFVAAGPGNMAHEDFEFLRTRIMAEELRRQSWIRDDYFGAFDNLTDAEAFIHYPRDLLNSEGVVATALFNLMMNSGISAVYPKLITTIVKHNPATLVDFFLAFGEEFPGDRAAASKVFVRQTLGVTRNPMTFDLFKNWRQTVAASDRTDSSAQVAWDRYSDAIETEVGLLTYEPVLNSLLNHSIKINTKDLSTHYPPFSIDLNQDTEMVLTMVFQDIANHYEEIGMASRVAGFRESTAVQAQAVISRREELHNLESLNDLSGYVDPDLLDVLRSNLMR